MKPKKTRNMNTWTEAKFWGKIRSLLRKMSMYWVPRREALRRARRPNESGNLRLKWQYKCSGCGKWFREDEVAVDHIIPCGQLKCLDDLAPFVSRLLPENPEAFQVLCTASCHHSKTQEEREARKHS